MILHLILLIIFSIMGVFGLIFQVHEGVIVGAALIPWEVRMILASRGKMNYRLVNIILAVAVIVGFGYFMLQRIWVRGFVLLGVQAYIYFVVSKSKARMNVASKDEQRD